jgi:diaminopimelate epimerase
MRWSFAKYVGCGNDFILFDNRHLEFPFYLPDLIPKLCHRQYGIGADGLIVLELSELADCRFRIFNADGSEAEMCGNGIRCFVKWLKMLGFCQSSFRIETMHQLLQATVQDDQVQIEMAIPSIMQWNIPFQWKEKQVQVHHVDIGVPHTLLFVEDVEALNLHEWGPYIRFHPLWMPKGTNFTAIELLHSKDLKIRTYERGVENETLACGTGATAAALAAAVYYLIEGPLTVQVRSGEELIIDFKRQGESFSDITMTGPAQAIFRGEIELPALYLAEANQKYSVTF